MKLFLGIDIGSVSVDTSILDENKKIIETAYTRTKGQPFQTTVKVLKEILNKHKIGSIAMTGSGGKLISKLTNALFINEIFAQSKATNFLMPNIKTIIEIGGEDSKLIFLNENGTIKDFAMNAICAAGTGSFLDQQATRLKVNIEDEFGNLALKSANPPRIAGRCSVFAKSDMIHLQQEGVPDYDIVAGLCHALARSFISNIVKGKKLEKPISFQGGVAANKGMIKAFQDTLNLKEGELVIPEHYACVGAIGAALTIIESERNNPLNEKIIHQIEEYINKRKRKNSSLNPLTISEELDLSVKHTKHDFTEGEKIDAYLGIDVGSLSTNVVAIDKNKKILSRVYLRTSGRPIEAVKEGIKIAKEEIERFVNIKGVATTGSGRYLLGKLVGADIVKNEITAQAKAAIENDPKIDTIFEIGGQDSKFISINNGVVVDFAMNKVCAAGTGSFLEEQSEKLDVSIKEEFGKCALESSCPTSLGERCTVFMESDLNAQKQSGAKKHDLISGLSYSIVLNYINKVVAGKKIGTNIYFQGAVAFNKGVVAAFRQVTGKDVKVTPNNDVTGAIGAALIALENQKEKSSFRGFDEIINIGYKQNTFECKSCSNRCEIKSVKFGDETPVFYGSRCEKYDVDKSSKNNDIPDLFTERMELLLKPYKKEMPENTKTIGIPLMLNFYEFFPLWNAFFTELGFKVVKSTITNKETIKNGLNNISAETCFPVKVAHGHIMDLLEKKVNFIFLPSMINSMNISKEFSNSYNCPYCQAIPYMINSAMHEKLNIKILRPIIDFRYGQRLLKKELEKIGEELGKNKEDVMGAWDKAEEFQRDFYKKLSEKGKNILVNLDKKAIVIVSRPYNGYDTALNLDLPKKLRNLGVLAIPSDFIPVDSYNLKDFHSMYWVYGQRILKMAEIIKKNNNLFALYITNFGCGPDSFIIRMFERKMGNKPHLQLEVDEHSADAGAITRCEAFLDSIENLEEAELEEKVIREPLPLSELNKKKTLYIPYMGDSAYAIKVALELSGYKVEVIPMATNETLAVGRKYTSGKECLPMIITTGDMVSIVKKPDFKRDETAFFMGTAPGPCRFGQYAKTQRIILDELGFNDVPICTLTATDSYKFNYKIMRLMWNVMCAIEILGKMLRKTRPYELNKGETDEVYKSCIDKLKKIKNRKDIYNVLKNSLGEFEKIKISNIKKPLIGMIGEIYVRNHEFANQDIIRKIESFGGEVWLVPTTEWFLYVTENGITNKKNERDYLNLAKNMLALKIQTMDEHKYLKLFKKHLKNYEEPDIFENLADGSKYIDASFRGEAILSMGKAIDFARKGVNGIISAVPFTCMPGTIVSAMTKKFRKDHEDIPFLNVFYDGTEETNADTRIEAFIHQAKQYTQKKKLTIQQRV